MWCNENHLLLNIGKTKELIINFTKKGEHGHIYINGTKVERVDSIKFLGMTVTDNLPWTSHVDVSVIFHPWTPFTRLTSIDRLPTSSKTYCTLVMTSYNLF
eukprot:g37489.t1